MSREIDLAPYIDHTFLKPNASYSDVMDFLEEAQGFSFKSVCLPPSFVVEAYKALSYTEMDICTVIGFPWGYNAHEVKMFEARKALDDGATELDVVINQSLLKNKDQTQLLEEMHDITELCHRFYGKVKWIVETDFLSKSEKKAICTHCITVKADFIKTSTGFAKTGAQLEDIVNWKKQIAENSLKIKASGGIKNKADALSFIKAGADRLGCSSGISILKEK